MANDGGSHDVQVYADITAEWITGNRSLTAKWATTTGDVLSHQIQLANQTDYVEINNRIQRTLLLRIPSLRRSTDSVSEGSAFHSTLNVSRWPRAHTRSTNLILLLLFVRRPGPRTRRGRIRPSVRSSPRTGSSPILKTAPSAPSATGGPSLPSRTILAPSRCPARPRSSTRWASSATLSPSTSS